MPPMTRLAGALAASLLLAAPAAAATVTRTFDVTVVDFQAYFTALPTPVDPMLASFTLTYDPDVALENTTDGLVVHGLNVAYDGYLAISYDPGPGAFRLGAITGVGDDVSTFHSGFGEVYLTFSESVPLGVAGSYQLANDTGFWISETGSVEATTAAVPEPATWGLMVLGFAACGAGLRTRRRALLS